MKQSVRRIGEYTNTCVFVLILLFSAAAVQAQPEFTKIFSPNDIGPGSQSRLTFFIENNAGVPATDLAFTDTLPAGMTIANPNGIVTDCVNGLITAPPGGSTITFTDGRVSAGTICTVEVNVTTSVVGVSTNTSGDLTSSLGNSGTATDDLTVSTDRPGFSKSFSPSTVNFGERSTLTFTIDNTLGANQVFNLNFTDVFPRGMVVADPPNQSSTCIGGTINAIPGSDQVSYVAAFSGDASVAAATSCAISVDVFGNARGILNNTSGSLTGASPFFNDSGFSGDTLEVVSSGDIQLTQAFIGDPIAPGTILDLEFTITNLNRNFDLTDISFTDDLEAALTGLQATGLPLNDVCGSGSSISGTSVLSFTGGNLGPEESCTFSVSVAVPGATVAGAYPNTTSAPTGQITGQPTNGNASSETLFVNEAPFLTKTFLTDPVGAGNSVTMEFTIVNQSFTSAATDITFNDDINAFVSGATVTALPAAGFCGAGSTAFTFINIGQLNLSVIGANLPAGGSCTFTVDLQLPNNVQTDVYTNTTTTISGTVDGTTQFGNSASADVTIVAGPTLEKEFIDDPVLPGDTVTLRYTLTNGDKGATFDATGIGFTDDFNAVIAGLQAVGLPINDVCGTGSSISGTTTLTLSGGNLLASESCTFDVTLQVPASALPGAFTSVSSVVTSTVNGVNPISDTASADLNISGINFTHQFIDDPVIPGEFVTVEYTIENDSATADATGIFFTHSYSTIFSGLSAISPTQNDVCGVGSQVSGTTFLILVGGNLLAGESCTFSVTLQVPLGANDGSFPSVTSNLTATIDGSVTAIPGSSDTLVIDSNVIEFNKSYLNDPVLPGDVVDLEFTLTNLRQTDAISGLSFTDNLDVSLSGLVATGLPLNDVCGNGSVISGSGLLTFTGGSLPAGGSCSFTVSLQVPANASGGDYTNITSSVSGTLNFFTVSGDPAIDDLVINQFTFAKQFGGTVDANDTTILEYTISNDTTSPATGLRFTDDLSSVLPGLRVEGALPTDPCGIGSQLSGSGMIEMIGGQLAASSSCSFSVTVRVPSTTIAGLYSSVSSTLFQGAEVVSQPAFDDLIVSGEWALRQSTVADYFFESNLKSIIPGAPDLIYGNPDNLNYATDTVSGQDKTVFRFASGEGLLLSFPNLLLSDEYSIAMLFALDSSNGFGKLIDFNELQQDEGFYNNSSFLAYRNEANSLTPTMTPNNYVQLLITRDITGEVIAYINDIEQFSFNDDVDDLLAGNAFDFFMDDAVTNNSENTSGSVARITIFDKVLAPNEVTDFQELSDIIFLNSFDD